MEKLFDKESLIDVMYTLHKEAKICDKDYRLWFKLNKNANISVRTSVGESCTSLVKNSIGQGMFGAALASSLNIRFALKDTFRDTPSTSLGLMPLNSLIMQDDNSKMNDRLEDARSGCDMIDDTLKRKQLSVNYDKSKYLLIGSQKCRNILLNTLKDKPMNMGGMEINYSGSTKKAAELY